MGEAELWEGLGLGQVLGAGRVDIFPRGPGSGVNSWEEGAFFKTLSIFNPKRRRTHTSMGVGLGWTSRLQLGG